MSFRGVAFLDLEPDQCRYPKGGDEEGEPILFCGVQPVKTGYPYCGSCCRVVYQAPRVRISRRVTTRKAADHERWSRV